jgi:hypothetical protein
MMTVDGAGSRLGGKKPSWEQSSHARSKTVGTINPMTKLSLTVFRFLRLVSLCNLAGESEIDA